MGLSQALIQALVVSNLKQHRRRNQNPSRSAARFELAVSQTARRQNVSEARVLQAVDDFTPSAAYEDQVIVLALIETLDNLLTTS